MRRKIFHRAYSPSASVDVESVAVRETGRSREVRPSRPARRRVLEQEGERLVGRRNVVGNITDGGGRQPSLSQLYFTTFFTARKHFSLERI